MYLQHSAQTPEDGQVTTASEVAVTLIPTQSSYSPTIFAAKGLGSIAFQAWNSGANTITATVYGSNDAEAASALWVDVSGTALDTIPANSASAQTYKETAPGYAFYEVRVINAAGVGTLHLCINQAGTV